MESSMPRFTLDYTLFYNNRLESTTFTFDDKVSGREWQAQASQIKHMIAAINDAPLEGRHEQYLVWLQSIETFRLQWGNAMVPKDIQTAVTDIQRNMGLPVTNW